MFYMYSHEGNKTVIIIEMPWDYNQVLYIYTEYILVIYKNTTTIYKQRALRLLTEHFGDKVPGS